MPQKEGLVFSDGCLVCTQSYADAAKSVIAEALEAARRSVANRKSKREAEAPAASDSVKLTTSQSKPGT